MSQHDNSYHHDQGDPGGPGGFSWFFQQIGWFMRKLVLWPIADSFRWTGRLIARFFDAFRYRSPFTYIGATLAVCVTAGAVAAAVYFHGQSGQAPVATQPDVPAQVADTVVPTPATPPATPAPAAQPGNSADTLQGVVPSFKRTSAAGKKATAAKRTEEKTLVKPSAPPDSGPLKVAHRFASSFAGYEIGEKKAARELKQTASPRLARELRANPPKLPAGGQVPKATVMNVVKGRKSKGRLAVSVALLRSGATSELRLALTRTPDSGWLVSRVLG